MRRTLAFLVILSFGSVAYGCSNASDDRAGIRDEMNELIGGLGTPSSIVVEGENCGSFSSPSCVELFALVTYDFGTSADEDAICNTAASLPEVHPVDPGRVVWDVRCSFEGCRKGYRLTSDVLSEQPEGEAKTFTLRIALSVGCRSD